jgi:thiopeptide-type bacteriocin biosynthesis protein
VDARVMWHSVHIFRSQPLDRLLIDEVKPFADALGKPLFFIRYNKPEWHIRLRVDCEALNFPGAIDAPYEPELDRYGGPSRMAIAERQFVHSSRAVLALMSCPGWSYDLAIAHAMRMHLTLIEAFEIEPRAFFERTIKRFCRMRDPRRRTRDRYEPAPDDPRWREQMRAIANEFGDTDPNIVQSFVHMTNNRLGIHFRDEAFVAAALA